MIYNKTLTTKKFYVTEINAQAINHLYFSRVIPVFWRMETTLRNETKGQEGNISQVYFFDSM